MRSPALMTRNDTALLVIDVQEKLAAVMPFRDPVVANVRRLVQAARILGLPVLATEQYPKGLGRTVPELADLGLEPVEKIAFSCCAQPDWWNRLQDLARVTKVLLAGMEAHVCVQQTALDLLSLNRGVYVAVDAICSRRKLDWKTACRRMAAAGAVLTTAEAAIFEWLEQAGTEEFRRILPLVK